MYWYVHTVFIVSESWHKKAVFMSTVIVRGHLIEKYFCPLPLIILSEKNYATVCTSTYVRAPNTRYVRYKVLQ